jgi:hypothetical protein
MSQRSFRGEQGFLTFALGEKYVKLAYLQALSIKTSQKINNYAVVVDSTNEALAKQYHHVFDKILVINHSPSEWDMTQHYRAFALTPWRETVMLDADILFNESVDHWWPVLRNKDVCLTNQVFNFREELITSRKYRKLFDENLLPDVYAGVMYFRYSQFANEFFFLLREITNNWTWIANDHLIKNDDKRFRIDEAVALAARIMGKEHVTLPIPIPAFVHGKEGLWKLSEQQPWHEQLYVEYDDKLLVGHYPQRLPFHYHHKEWINDDIIRTYERNYQKLSSSY